jgi:hypothetical protein
LRRWFQLTWVTWTFQPSSSEYLQTWFQMATMNSLPSGQRSGRFWTVVESQNHHIFSGQTCGILMWFLTTIERHRFLHSSWMTFASSLAGTLLKSLWMW